MGPVQRRRASFFEQRTLLISLGAFVAVSLTFGIFRLFSGIHSPFASVDENAAPSNLEEMSANLLALSAKDTDADQLNDFEELYQTGTSPYLADSDSDGIGDLNEIQAGTNPNCPEGQQCTGYLPPDVTNPTTNATNTNPDENLTATAIRETLKASGSPEYLLDATSDEELLNLYQQVAGGEEVATNSSTPSTLETLKNFSPADIRDLLASTGADASLLEQMSDEDLQDIFDQALDEQQDLFTGTESTTTTTNTNSTTGTSRNSNSTTSEDVNSTPDL